MADPQFKCPTCASSLRYSPGTSSLACVNCSGQVEIDSPVVEAKSESFELAIASLAASDATALSAGDWLAKCSDCGSETERPERMISAPCAYCGAPLVDAPEASRRKIAPKYLLPFHLDSKQAGEACRQWMKGLWFAPNDFTAIGRLDKLQGIYVPCWTFDTQTTTRYSGQRGDAYYETQWVTVNGKREMRQVRKVRWRSASGVVFVPIRDLVVIASNSMKENRANALEPWDLNRLHGFDNRFLAGFVAEAYQVDLNAGFQKATILMRPAIERAIRFDIGGDEQRITSNDTQYADTAFKHLLVPVWISAIRYKGRIFQVLVNARTAEVQGDRPYSWIKITFAVMAALLLILLYFSLQGDRW